MTMKVLKNKHDFKALPLQLDGCSSFPHTIYFKEHSVREHTKDKPSGRTLFVLNIPPYADEKGIINAFSRAGKIQSVKFSSKPSFTDNENINKFLPEPTKPSFRIAYVVFEKVSELDKALKLNELCPMNSNAHKIKVGLEKWIEEYNNTVIMPNTLKANIESYMKRYDAAMKIAELKDKALAEEDDEGWVTVTKKGKTQSFPRTESVENKIMAKEEKGRKRKELKNFYTFQIRESKMKHIVALRQKFEEDKRKIAQIKQNRRFKPF